MSKMSKPAIVVGGVLVVIAFIGFWIVGNYNSLVSSKNQVEKSWSMVETQYQRRMDLVDNLVSSVKGAQGQEREVFIKIAEARTKYNSATTDNGKAEAAGNLETNIALIPRLQEAYPELKSNQQVQTLMTELSGTEGGILKARDTYNATATNYNTNIERFPKSMFANTFGFEKKTLFKSDEGASKATKVQF